MEGEQNSICIKYINDLELEIKILEDIKQNSKFDIAEVENQIFDKKQLLEKCKENLSKFSEDKICYRLYLNILNGMTPSKAVEKVAEENLINGVKPTDFTHIWKKYYKKVKKMLNTKENTIE